MKTFKEFFANTKEPISWLSWDGSHAAIRDKVKLPKESWLNYDGSFRAIRKSSLKEEELTSNIRWSQWNNSYMKPGSQGTTTNKKGKYYDKIHDDSQIVPNDSEDEVPSIGHYCSTESKDSKNGHCSSANVNNHLRHLAGQPVSEGGEGSQGIVGGHSPDKVRDAIRDLSATFKGNTNRKPLKVFAGIPKHIGEKIEASGQGAVHRNPGFLSTSTEQGMGLDYATQYAEKDHVDTHHVVQLHLHPGAGRSVVHHSRFEENEVLVHHGAKMVYSHTENHETPSGHPLKLHHLEVFPDHEKLENYPNFGKN